MSTGTQKNILIAGAGKIGCTLATILSSDSNTHVTLVDVQTAPLFTIDRVSFVQCDIQNTSTLKALIQQNKIHGIVSTLPYFCNKQLAKIAKDNHCHYFDVTEDVDTTNYIFSIAQQADTAFVPQCGVAPGLINIIANDLIHKKYQQKKNVHAVKLYCGALPQKNENALGYALTWSTEGLINEYGNPCRVLENGAIKMIPSLSADETLKLEGSTFEAFSTSGGTGTLIDTYQHKIDTMFYKTMRYPGHCEKMRFLMYDLKLNEDRDTLKKILENALPKGGDDVVITHVEVDELHDTRYFYPTQFNKINCSAIQAVTATSAATVIDTVISNPDRYHGPIKQEDFKLEEILNNQHANYLKQQRAMTNGYVEKTAHPL